MRNGEFSALVLRLPENVTYLSGAWCGRGLSYLVFPYEKDPILIHPSGETLPPTWVSDIRYYTWETYENLGDSLDIGTSIVRDAISELGLRSGIIGLEQGWEFVFGSSLRYEVNVIGERTQSILKQKLRSFTIKDASQLLR